MADTSSTQSSASNTPKTQSGQEGHGRSTEYAREQAKAMARSAQSATQDAAVHYVREPAEDLVGLLKDYAREKPDVAAMWCFGLGVLIGWKLRP